ncbi:MAG: hypothetical protein U0470_06515 [Anaerolineae bacterium]
MPARRVLARLPLLALLSIGLLGGSAMPATAPFAPAAARAQSEPEIVVPLYGQTITFRTDAAHAGQRRAERRRRQEEG